MAIPALKAHMPVARSETSTTVPSPVRSRCNSAVEIPPAMNMAPMESPTAGAVCPGMRSTSGICAAAALPDRAQYPRESYPPASASGPWCPYPLPRTYTMFGFLALMSSTSIFNLRSTLGSLFVRNTSADSASR